MLATSLRPLPALPPALLGCSCSPQTLGQREPLCACEARFQHYLWPVPTLRRNLRPHTDKRPSAASCPSSAYFSGETLTRSGAGEAVHLAVLSLSAWHTASVSGFELTPEKGPRTPAQHGGCSARTDGPGNQQAPRRSAHGE